MCIYIYVCTVHILQVCSNHIGCFLKWWVFPPLKHPKCWSFVGKKTMGLLGTTHHFRSCAHMGVSENSGTPKIIHFNRVFHYFHHPFWGKAPYFRKHPYISTTTWSGDLTSTPGWEPHQATLRFLRWGGSYPIENIGRDGWAPREERYLNLRYINCWR